MVTSRRVQRAMLAPTVAPTRRSNRIASKRPGPGSSASESSSPPPENSVVVSKTPAGPLASSSSSSSSNSIPRLFPRALPPRSSFTFRAPSFGFDPYEKSAAQKLAEMKTFYKGPAGTKRKRSSFEPDNERWSAFRSMFPSASTARHHFRPPSSPISSEDDENSSNQGGPPVGEFQPQVFRPYKRIKTWVTTNHDGSCTSTTHLVNLA